jgi:hypothetical protein
MREWEGEAVRGAQGDLEVLSVREGMGGRGGGGWEGEEEGWGVSGRFARKWESCGWSLGPGVQ